MGANGEQWDSGDQITPARMNQKTVTADTGANCNADTKYAGKIFMPSSSNGSLTADIPAYVKADASTLEDFLTKTSAQTPTNKTLLSDVPRRRYYLTGLTGLYTFTGTGTPGTVTQGAGFLTLATGATSGSTARINTTLGAVITNRRDRRFEFHALVTTTATGLTASEYEIGLTNTDGAALSAAAQHHATFQYDSAAGGNWLCRSADATTQQSTDSTVALATSTDYLLSIINDETSMNFYINGTLRATNSTNVPGASTNLVPRVYLKNTAAANKDLQFAYFDIWSDAA